MDPATPTDPEVAFGQYVVANGLVTAERVTECLRLLSDLAVRGVAPLPRLADLMLEKGYLTRELLERTLKVNPPTLPTVPAGQSPPASGERFGAYVKVEKLGEGGMGEVWKAWDSGLGRWVALKLLKGQNSDERARFRREAQTAARLSHPNIAAIYEAQENCIAMQFVDGETLSSFPRRDKRRVVEIVRDAALAVHYAHEQGVIHRDLKPANIMTEMKSRRAYVMDFGLAKAAEVDTRISLSGTIVGTPSYMSPEQAQGREVGPAGDVYSLGATLYHVLTGRLPFEDPNFYSLIARVIEVEPKPPHKIDPSIDGDLETIVLKCLEKDPAQRFASAEALAQDLTRWLGGEAIRAHPPSTIYRLRKFIARRRAVVMAAGAGLLVAAVVAAWLVPRWARESRARRAAETEKDAQRVREFRRLQAMDRARTHLESGRRVVEQMRIRKRDADHRDEELAALSDEARRHFDRALAEVPNLAEAHLGVGQAHALAGQTSMALEAVDRAVAAAPTFAPAYLDRVRLRVDDYERMKHEFSSGEARQETPESGRLRAELEADLAQVARHARESAERLYGQGLLAFCHGRFDEAQRLLGEYLRSAPADGPARYWRGHALYHLSRHADAEAELTEAIKCDARYHRAYFNRGAVRRSRGSHDAALADYGVAIRLSPGNAAYYHNRANVCLDLAQWDAAIADYDRAIAIDPDYATALAHRGIARANKGDFDAALRDCDRSVALKPDWAEGYNTRGYVRHGRNELNEAIADYTRAIERRADYAEAYSNRGGARAALKDYKRALDDYTEAIRIKSDYWDAWSNRAVVKFDTKDYEGSVRDYDEALKLRPKWGQGYYNRGRSRRWAGDLDGAISDFTKCIEIMPRHAGAWGDRGIVRHIQGDLPGAIADYEKALEVAPQDWPHREMIRRQLAKARGE